MPVAAQQLANFYPLDKLRPQCLEQLAKVAAAEDVGKGTLLFAAGDLDEDMIYVVAGNVRCEYPDGKVKTTEGSSLQGRYALGDLQPRRFSASVGSLAAQLIRLDRRYTEKVIIWDQLSRTEAFRHFDPDPEANRWVFRVLQNRALHKLPTGAVERLFQRMEEIAVVKDQRIVREGDEADFFYVIKEGSAAVAKQSGDSEAVLAYLMRGDTFGEDALLTRSVRNASVSMMSDGRLMRLSSKDFAEILTPPVVDWVKPAAARALVQEGARLLDVRSREEYQERALKGALNIPLLDLRDRIDELDRGCKLVVYCNTGERSAAATFILSKVGFDSVALQGGLSAMFKQGVGE